MSVFICSKCGCVDNTATSDYWAMVNMPERYDWSKMPEYYGKPLCSECGRTYHNVSKGELPKVLPGFWHGKFTKKEATLDEKRRCGGNGLIN